MALIKCPECGKDVSDQASTCIHCGYPLRKQAEQKIVSTFAQVPSVKSIKPFYLFSFDESFVNLECGNCEKIFKYKKQYFYDIHDSYCVINFQLTCPNCKNGVSKNTKIITKDNRNASNEKNNRNASIKKENDVLRCPKCNSTAVSTGSRGFSIITGFLGSGRTVNRCGKCGYTWKP